MANKSKQQTLEGYLQEKGVSQRDFAAQVGSYQSVISRLLRGTLRPSLDLAYRIDVATGGAVGMSSWAEAPQTQKEAS
ncbi:helix-turn-helix domain-containing protein [Halocynthiibacter sp. C4]|uniref:helix-turn-helix domain-containing protein n=1 Tax=Halocynthiibacter sp. C4 TaxID=2992758 RepID=UPI00237BEF20|nr:helix-turn-helix transcriptional regulator [Halocynthiibacter sp. C4]